MRGKIHKQYSPFTCDETKLKSWEKMVSLKKTRNGELLAFLPILIWKLEKVLKSL